MAGRRSERSRKSVNYSKFSSGGNNSDKDDDDDFMEQTPPNKKKKTKKSPNASTNKTNGNSMEQKNTERKARNRLSEDERYQRQLEEVVKMSLIDSEHSNIVTDNPNSSQDSTQSEQDTQTSCIVHAQVLESPNTKLLQNTSTKREGKVEIQKDVILNEAAQCKDDEITSDPVEDNKETGKRKSGRSKKIKEKQEEDEYEMSDESDSEDEVSVEEESAESDYAETPKKKQRATKSVSAKEKKSAPKKAAVSKKTTGKPASITAPPLRKIVHANKENKVPLKTRVLLKKPALSRSSLTKTPTTSTLPKAPQSSTSLFLRRSPVMIIRPGKFLQKGWTPPGPAGSKTDILKSPQPQSPNFIRVGLSRNERLTPLHPKLNIK